MTISSVDGEKTIIHPDGSQEFLGKYECGATRHGIFFVMIKEIGFMIFQLEHASNLNHYRKLIIKLVHR